ncbi:MAG: RNA 2',3'-cyclic phosphodiesterase [Terriglobia bacterium]|nr:RNA 2',3'-cyclic phosphodiesterase [Terriglobia bacterium]
MRLFVGIPLAATVIEELSAITTRLQSNEAGLRWSAPESRHITLQFLGTASQQQYECLVDRLRAPHLSPVPIKLESLGLLDRAGIFFAGVRITPALLSLQQHVIAATGHCGFIPEDRPYRPHITLARAKGKGGAQHLEIWKSRISRQPSFTSFIAKEFILYESFTRSTGSHYEIRERFRLDGR